MTDDLERRLRAADPARRAPEPDGAWIPDLVETIMSTTQHHPAPSDVHRPRRLLGAVAAAAAVAALGLGGVALLGDAPGPAQPPALELALSGDAATMSCMTFSVDVLAAMPVAFSGTVTEVRDGTVVLDVDRWYRGGESPAGPVDRVELSAPDGAAVALVGAVEFAPGQRYLVSASEGTVSVCGFSGPWSPELAAAYEQAFGG
jgi:hypothetical protein